MMCVLTGIFTKQNPEEEILQERFLRKHYQEKSGRNYVKQIRVVKAAEANGMAVNPTIT